MTHCRLSLFPDCCLLRPSQCLAGALPSSPGALPFLWLFPGRPPIMRLLPNNLCGVRRLRFFRLSGWSPSRINRGKQQCRNTSGLPIQCYFLPLPANRTREPTNVCQLSPPPNGICSCLILGHLRGGSATLSVSPCGYPPFPPPSTTPSSRLLPGPPKLSHVSFCSSMPQVFFHMLAKAAQPLSRAATQRHLLLLMCKYSTLLPFGFPPLASPI